MDSRHYAAEVDVLGDPSARLAMFREAMDAGGYRRIGALSPDMGPAALGQHFTFRETATTGVGGTATITTDPARRVSNARE